MLTSAFVGILIPFAGTTIGSACVFFMKKSLHPGVQRALTGFAAGVMVAASIWSLLSPAMEQSAALGRLAFLPACSCPRLSIPEGMAVGVVYAGYLTGSAQITAMGALALSLGIAIQNFPEGAIISMPLKAEGMSKGKAFLMGTLSGAVEPLGALFTIWAAGLVVPALPYLLSFAAGAMLYVVIEELIPEMSQGEHSNVGTICFALGFTLMMALDVALG